MDAGQDMSEHLSAHALLSRHEYPEILLGRGVPSPSVTQSVVTEVFARGPNLAPGLAELHEVHMDPLLEPAMVPLDGTPSLKHFNGTT